MRTRVKICCMGSVEEVRIAVAAGADAVGLVAEMPSGPGPIADALIAAIAAAVPPPVTPFLLTQRQSADEILDHAAATGVTTVQLVRQVDADVHRALRVAARGLRIVQVVHVEDERAVELARLYAETADALLLDSGRPSLAVAELGGTGRAHDWRISRRIVEAVQKPVFLAGGLTPANAAEAIGAVRPFGLDLCSGVRTEGALDPVRLAAFVAAVRAADG
jgi:phosphoribosylanthranilate isomerase